MDQNYNNQNQNPQFGNGWQYQNGAQQYQNATQQAYAQQAQQPAYGPNYGYQYQTGYDQNGAQTGYGQQYQNAAQAGFGAANQAFGNQAFGNQAFGNSANSNNFYDDGIAPQGPTEGVIAQLSAAMAQEVIAKSFLYMVAALLVTAVAAFTVQGNMLKWMINNFYVVIGAELIVALVSNVMIKKGNAVVTAILFTVYSYLTGLTLGLILLAYTGTSVAAVFVVTAVTFGIMAVYGLVTDADLSSVGSICMMGLIGIILASIVNLFLHNTMMDMIISWIGIAIFVGLTAYDTQKIKKAARYDMGDRVAVVALAGAFELYLDFINLFLRLLRVMGKRK
ncbi:MAG: Bax inhibitor-1/YccA family protein [Lachnospiraceae bacterium]|nr:Bax inhibitor-1/YccA family protein [Lachnospiraceae bacterium]